MGQQGCPHPPRPHLSIAAPIGQRAYPINNTIEHCVHQQVALLAEIIPQRHLNDLFLPPE